MAAAAVAPPTLVGGGRFFGDIVENFSIWSGDDPVAMKMEDYIQPREAGGFSERGSGMYNVCMASPV